VDLRLKDLLAATATSVQGAVVVAALVASFALMEIAVARRARRAARPALPAAT